MNLQQSKYFYLSLSIIPVMIGIIGFLALLQSPYTGLHFATDRGQDNKWYISSIDAGSPAYQYREVQGMEVVSINNWQVEGMDLNKEFDTIKEQKLFYHFIAANEYLDSTIQINKPMRLTLRGDGKVYQVEILPGAHPLAGLLQKLATLFTIAFITLFIGLIVISNKTNMTGIIFFSISMLLSTLDVSLALVKARDIAMNFQVLITLYWILTFSIIYLFYLLLYFFASLFPIDKKINIFKFPANLIHIFILAVILLVGTRWLYPLYPLSGFFCMSAIAVMILYNYLTITTPSYKAQIKVVVLGTVSTALFTLLVYFLPLLMTGSYFISSDIPLVVGVMLPLSIAFAIMRYKLMDIDTLFDNTIIYSITIALLAFIDAAVVYLFTSNKIPLLTVIEPFPTIIAVWVIIFTYLPVRNLVRDFIKKLLKREIYDLNEVSVSYSRNLLSVYSVDDVKNMAQSIVERTLHPKAIDIEVFHQPQLLQPIINNETGGALIPLTATSGNIGAITLGGKHSGRLYDRNDVKLLDTIANQTALAIESIRHREEIRRREEEAQREKERINREIHDGIGNSFVQAIVLSNALSHEQSHKRDTLLRLQEILHEGLSDLRELMWTIDTATYSLSDMVSYIQSRLSFLNNSGIIACETVVDMDMEVADSLRLSYETKSNIVRIIQEAVNNILKYAKANSITVTISYAGSILTVSVKDDGTGFDTTKGSSGYGMKNMRVRAEKIGAAIGISSAPGQGSEVKLEINLPGE